MQVQKRSGAMEPVSFDKILLAVQRNAGGLDRVDVAMIAKRAIDGMFDGISTRALDELCARACADLVIQEPEYSVLGGRILCDIISEDVKVNLRGGGRVLLGHSMLDNSLDVGIKRGLVSENIYAANGDPETMGAFQDFLREVDASAEPALEVFGAYTVMERYLLKDPVTRVLIETPKQWLARVALGISDNIEHARRHWRLMMDLKTLPSTPTLFNSGTTRAQMSSCFLMDSPEDSLDGIGKTIWDGARLGKFAGGIAGSITGVRSLGSLIRGTNGQSNGIMPWLKIDDAAVGAVNQGGKRLGAKAWYLETWHADIFDFLSSRDQDGDMNRRTFNLNQANWVPDEFMRRVDADEEWSLFDPNVTPDLKDLWGEAFDQRYRQYEAEGKAAKVVRARALFEKMMKMLAETGNGWMCWKDRSNALCNQTYTGSVVHSSNLCTEIIEVTKTDKWVAVCNLASMVASKYVGAFRLLADGRGSYLDSETFGADVEFTVRQLDCVIDRNYYTIPETKNSNLHWRPVGLGLMGLTDAFHELGLVYGSPETHALNEEMFERMYYHALRASCDLAREKGPCPAWEETRTRQEGKLHHELWGAQPKYVEEGKWLQLKLDIARWGLRNSLLIAVAPTATIALIAGVSECTEPMQQLAIRRETMSGDFIQISKYAVREMQKLGLWTEENITTFKLDNGSIQNIPGVPQDIKDRFKTAFEIKQRTIIDMAVGRAPWIDQSQSLNLFNAAPTIGVLSSMYMAAWKAGLKTTYYLRRRPPTEIAKTVSAKTRVPSVAELTADEPIKACAIDDPSCESCQ